jgi:hypothetical protein
MIAATTSGGDHGMDTIILVAIGILLLVLFPALGWKSLHYLREAPDIPHKREMMWGAKYWGLIYDLVAVVPVIAGPLMIHYDVPWAMIGATAWIGLIPLATVAGLITYWPGIGHGAALSIWGASWRGEEFDWAEFVEDFERKRGAWWNKAAIWIFLILIPVWGYFALTRIIPAEGMTQAMRWSDRVEARMAEATADLPTEEIIVAREIFSGPGHRPMPKGAHDNNVLIRLEEAASREQQRRALDTAKQVLAAENAPLEWYIRVSAEDEEPLAETWQRGGTR